MVLIYKNQNSKSTQNLQQLSKEYLTKLGCGNLDFPTRSQELAEDTYSQEVWGYVLRYITGKEKNLQEGKEESQAVTNVSFIKEDFKNAWLDKVHKTKNVTNHLRMALLVHDAHKEATLNE